MRPSASRGIRFLKERLLDYVFAALAVVAALLVRKALDPVLGTSAPYVTLFPAVACVAIFGGNGPAMLTTLVGLAGVTYWWLPAGTLSLIAHDTAKQLAAILYLALCGLIITVSHFHRKNASKLQRLQEDNERQVAIELDAMRRLQETGTFCMKAGNGYRECLDSILDAALFLTGAEKGTLHLLDGTGALKIAAQRGFAPPFLSFFDSVEVGTAAASAMALSTRKRMAVDDVARAEIFDGKPSRDILLQAQVRALQCTPLVSGSGNVLGIISTHFSEPHRLPDREARLMDLLSRQAADYLERKQSEESLRVASAQLQQLLEATPTGITRCSRDLRYLAINSSCASMLGLPESEVLGRPIVEVMGTAAWEKIEPYVQRVLRGERVEYEAALPYRVVGTRHVHVIYTPETNSQNEVIGWFASITDITHFSRLEEQLRKAEKLAAAGQLAASLAHEINNPLESVTNVLYLLDCDDSLSPEARTMAQIARREMSRLTRIVRQSLSYYRVGAVAKQFDLAAVVRESLEILSDKINRNRIQVETKFAGPPSMMGFQDEVRQVLDNLLLNAIEAMPTGGHLKVAARLSSNWGKDGSLGIRLTIADTGCGIAKENLDRLFEPFFTTKSDKGTGLGLWAVRAIVAKHNGDMRIRSSHSAAKTGTVVSIFWPHAQAEATSEQAHSVSAA